MVSLKLAPISTAVRWLSPAGWDSTDLVGQYGSDHTHTSGVSSESVTAVWTTWLRKDHELPSEFEIIDF